MPAKNIEGLDPKGHIIIKGARVNNLKNVSVAIPRKKFVVITGVSGSGKSSLAFDTLYAEGQRRYVESLSSYARQFMGRLDKPEVDYIRGISPAVVVEQRVVSRSSRSTVGTTTEIYDYLKLLFARIGETLSPISGKIVRRHTPEDVLKRVQSLENDARYYVLAPLRINPDRGIKIELDLLLQKGFTRIMSEGELIRIDDETHASLDEKADIFMVVDRLAKSEEHDHETRLLDSVETAFFEGHGDCSIKLHDSDQEYTFSNRFELDGITFEEPTPNFFSFNNPLGACKTCEGFGSIIGIDHRLVIPNTGLSIYQDAIVCWTGEKMKRWKEKLIMSADEFNFPIHKPISQLTTEQYDLLWKGNKYFKGLDKFFEYLAQKAYKIQYRVMLSRYRGKTTCPDCKGTRIRKDAHFVKIDGRSIIDLVQLSVEEATEYFTNVQLSENQAYIARHLLKEISNRLGYLSDVGLDYLTLNRLSNTLSGGESQRINLSTCLGSSLVGSMYILDEPSIGLHSRDTQRLIKVLKSLRDLGNTVIVVEHDEEVMKEADEIIDMGPLAGTHGGELIFQGNNSELLLAKDTLTGKYLSGELGIYKADAPRKLKDTIEITGAREHNLKDISVKIPLHALVAVTGVSGSGKSTLIGEIFYPALRRELGEYGDRMGEFDKISGDIKKVKAIEYVDQNPIGISSRSNPVTYVKAFDDIRALFASNQISKARLYKPAHFSFNVAGGRCDECEGEGMVTIGMQFMADIKLKCSVCKGQRYKDEILEVEYREKNISQILELTVDDALEFFSQDDSTTTKRLVSKLLPLQKVGLGYVQLGQSSNTLSGGEAQRIKLASFLAKGDRVEHTLFIFDEPTTGLHFDDVKKLLDSFEAIIAQGHSIIVIEHNIDVIKCADWVIDLGPEGGDKGGNLVFAGRPEELATIAESHTGKFLKDKLETVES
jgi:excinuclease ABC subunit A